LNALITTRARRGALVLVALIAATLLYLLAIRAGSQPAIGDSAAHVAPVGIESAFSPEQAPVLAEMKVSKTEKIDGFTFYIGTIGGRPVVDTLSGEINSSAEEATYILDTRFHPRAVLYTGTAGSQNNAVHVGDVVLSGFVVDKSAIHYFRGGYQENYGGTEVMLTKHSRITGSKYSYDEVTPATPKDASTYGYGPSTKDKKIAMVSAFAAPKQLVDIARRANVGTTPLWDATTGSKPSSGTRPTIKNKTFAGVIGTADVWTEPLSWIEAQNALYPTDAEENEGVGFAFTNAQLGVPWLLVRGISDSVWYPNAYDGVRSSDHAAKVVKYVVTHLPTTLNLAPEKLSTLSASSNARRYGYLVAKQAYYRVSPVTRIVANGKTMSAAKLKKLNAEYRYAAGGLK
jgi:adenosylhomocysteine nucleosidase